MYFFFRIFFTGLTISLLGTLPLGTLNLTSLQVALADGFLPAVGFALGVLLVEMVYVRITLAGIEWLRKKERWLLLFDQITIALMIAVTSVLFSMADLAPANDSGISFSASI